MFLSKQQTAEATMLVPGGIADEAANDDRAQPKGWFGRKAPRLPPGLVTAWFRAGLALGMLSDGTCPGEPCRPQGTGGKEPMWAALGRVFGGGLVICLLGAYVWFAVYGGRR